MGCIQDNYVPTNQCHSNKLTIVDCYSRSQDNYVPNPIR